MFTRRPAELMRVELEYELYGSGSTILVMKPDDEEVYLAMAALAPGTDEAR